MTDADLARFVAERGIAARLVYPGAPTPTVEAAAAAVGVAPGRIVKSLVFALPDGPLLVIAAGDGRLAYGELARALGVRRKALRLAAPEEAEAITGYPVGAMPPFGHRRGLRAVAVDAGLAPDALVYAGGGSREALLELRYDTLLEAAGADLVTLGGPSTAPDAAPR